MQHYAIACIKNYRHRIHGIGRVNEIKHSLTSHRLYKSTLSFSLS